MLLRERVGIEMAVRRRRRAVYATTALFLTLGEIAASTAAAFTAAAGLQGFSAGFSLGVATLLAIDSSFKVRERAAWHHAAFLQLRAIDGALEREAARRPSHPLEDDFQSILADQPIDLLASATELCCAP